MKRACLTGTRVEDPAAKIGSFFFLVINVCTLVTSVVSVQACFLKKNRTYMLKYI